MVTFFLHVRVNRKLALIVALTALPFASAQFTDTFDALDPAWITNRFEPAGFTVGIFDGDSRLQLTIAATDSTANRPPTFSSAFYNTQGRQRAPGITGLWSLSAEVYVASAFATTTGPLVRTGLWGHTGSTPAGGDFMILGFSNASLTAPLDPDAVDRAFRFRIFDSNFGEFVDLGVPTAFVFDTWHTLTGTFTGTDFDYFIDGNLVYTKSTTAGADLLDAMIQGYNFGQDANTTVNWDNVTASAIPEPAAGTLVFAAAALGWSWWRRRPR